MVEQRVIGQKIGARPAAPTASPPEHTPDVPEKGGKKKRGGRRRLVVVLLILVVVLAGGAAAYLTLGQKHSGAPAAPKPTPTAVAGKVLNVAAVSINLAGGHYLRLGLAIQLSTAAAQTPDPAQALDLAIALYSGRTVDEVSGADTRAQLKTQLLGGLQKAYGEEVMEVYFTDYVTQ